MIPSMRVLVAKPCKHGNIAGSDKGRHCLCPECKAEAYARRSAWAKANPDAVKRHSERWVSDNREKRRKIEAAWKAKNPERVAAHNARSGAKWSKTNAGRRNAITAKRRAAIRQRMVPWADQEAIAAIYEMAARLSRETGVRHEVDHIIPLQGWLVSGLHVHQNLQIITRSQNRAKQNRWSA